MPGHLPDRAIRSGRDQVREVLQPLLGEVAALERANNIAQALVFGGRDPMAVAIDMLRHTGLPDTSTVAEKIDRAWREGTMRPPPPIEGES